MSRGVPRVTRNGLKRSTREILEETCSEWDDYVMFYGEILVGLPGEIS